MSLVKIQGNASGTGEFTIAAPNSNTNRTLTLPDNTGTILTSASTIAGTGVTDSASPFETAFGSGAGPVNTGTYNTFIGFDSGNDNTSGAYNTALGALALTKNTTAGDSTAVGAGALENSTGQSNTALGAYSLNLNTTGTFNTAVGRLALYTNTTGERNVAVGYNALAANTTGVRNTAVGYQSLNANTTGQYSTAVGYDALLNSTGGLNTAVGFQAGNGITTGDKNVCIGYDVDTSGATGSDQIVIGSSITGQGNSNVTMGSSGGKIYNAFTVNATWTQTSDERLKKNIQNDTLGLSFINRLRPVKYEWKASNELDQDNPYYAEENRRTIGVTMHGLLAQEVKIALDAEGVMTFAGWDQGPDGIQSISREMFITPLIKAIQELSAKVEALEAQLATTPATPPAEPNA
jgi:hypothetical protein